MIEQVVRNAKEVSKKLSSRNICHASVSEILGCGSTLISMYSGGASSRKASKSTAYVLEMLNRHFDLVMNERRRKDAIAHFMSSESILQYCGFDYVSERLGISVRTLHMWAKRIPDLWTPSQERRISVAVLRIMAIVETESLRGKDDDQLELDLSEKPEKSEKPKGCCEGFQVNKVTRELRGLASVLDKVTLNDRSLEDLSFMLSEFRRNIKDELDARRREIEEELAVFKDLGL